MDACEIEESCMGPVPATEALLILDGCSVLYVAIQEQYGHRYKYRYASWTLSSTHPGADSPNQALPLDTSAGHWSQDLRSPGADWRPLKGPL